MNIKSGKHLSGRAAMLTHPNVKAFIVVAATDDDLQMVWSLITKGEGRLDASKNRNVIIVAPDELGEQAG